MFDEIRNRSGRIDVLVNNTGIGPGRSFEEFDESDWDRIVNTNFKSVFMCMRHALPMMSPGSVVLNISSIHATTTTSKFAIYASSKGGIEAGTRGLAVDLAFQGNSRQRDSAGSDRGGPGSA